MTNSNLHNAKVAKNDEFYTQLSDIEKEMKYYRNEFKDKIIYCNCDDCYESNFFKYFALNFKFLGLKKLITTCYAESNVADYGIFSIQKQDNGKKAYKIEINNVDDFNSDGVIDIKDIVSSLIENKENHLTILNGNGDFRSRECLELLKECDVVVTNPPFSLFREFISQLIEYDKKFIVIGNQNAITYKDIFPLFKENKMWLGNGFSGNVGFFSSPYEDRAVSSQHKDGLIRVSGVMWFTNIDIKKRHKKLILYKTYNKKDYPKYDNYDAINVDKVADIPCDYDGVMGVPITFLDKYNEKQFEILGISSAPNIGSVKRLHDVSYYDGYTRGKVITKMDSNMPILNINSGGTKCTKPGNKDLYQLYWRIFIKRR